MSTRKEDLLARLRRFNGALLSTDPEMAKAQDDLGKNEALEGARTVDAYIGEETIVMRRTRPVLAIKQNQAQLVFEDADDSPIWRDRLTKAKDVIEAAIRAVGRIELAGHPDFEWVGTGWLVDPEILVTNRHVANIFAVRRGETLVFRPASTGAMSAGIDFLQELDGTDALTFKVLRVLHIEDPGGPDIAFLAVEPRSEPKLATPIPLASRPAESPNVATIGYPAYDSRIPEPDLMVRIYGNRFNKKRLAPGAVTRVEEFQILHNCTTLGGNSGSVVVDLDRGEAVGLHFSGTFLTTNYAVRSDVVKARLDGLRTGTLRMRPEITAVSARSNGARPPAPRRTTSTARVAGRAQSPGGASASVSIPLVVTVSFGDSLDRAQRVRPAVAARPRSATDDDGDGVATTEASPADYQDREGYRPDFLGKKFPVPLPVVKRDIHDVLSFGQGETELRYEHFSVVMSKSRRVCRFSAANIDGGLSKKSKRAGWRLDPRIPKGQQILKECYGSPPKFSRGHMTRREDPAWGTPATVQRGNEDSMHVTNTVPQMQSFNAPVWLGLEDYALQHAREDDMKISVFTGPYLEDDDPVMYGVDIPVMFWKIIAFIHDDTGKLCATGYEMTQENNLQDPEFVFGDFVSPQLNVATQVSIKSIEARTGITFGDLASRDPKSSEDESVDGGGRTPLAVFEQIRFF